MLATNLALAIVIGTTVWLAGLGAWLPVQMPIAILAGTVGVFMFYVQHQFEDAYGRAPSAGATPTLSARIPNYNLQRTHDENPIFHDVPVLSVGDGLRAIRLKVVDPQGGRLLTWSQVKARTQAASP